MQKARAGSQLQTEPSQAKPQLSSFDPKIIQNAVIPQATNDPPLQENEYSNEFLQPVHNEHPDKQQSKGFAAGYDGHRVNRSKTQPKEPTLNQGNRRRRPVLLPQIKPTEGSKNTKKMQEKMLKLRELYQKKSKLYRKLQFVNKKLIKAKMQISFPHDGTLPLRTSLNPTAAPLTNQKSHSKSHTNSRNNNHLFDFGRPKNSSPQSITSVAKNRQVISFIQKMHEESVRRDLNRYERSQKMVASQLSHVCLECSRAKCQADAVGRILKESRMMH